MPYLRSRTLAWRVRRRRGGGRRGCPGWRAARPTPPPLAWSSTGSSGLATGDIRSSRSNWRRSGGSNTFWKLVYFFVFFFLFASSPCPRFGGLGTVRKAMLLCLLLSFFSCTLVWEFHFRNILSFAPSLNFGHNFLLPIAEFGKCTVSSFWCIPHRLWRRVPPENPRQRRQLWPLSSECAMLFPGSIYSPPPFAALFTVTAAPKGETPALLLSWLVGVCGDRRWKKTSFLTASFLFSSLPSPPPLSPVWAYGQDR